MSYERTVTVELPYADAVEQVRSALAGDLRAAYADRSGETRSL